MAFEEIFNRPPEARVQAPGRVNLLGEHTDYNQGFVLPTLVPYFTYVEAAKAEGRVEAYAEAYQERRSRPLGAARQGDWLDYLAGCVWALGEAGYPVPGILFYVHSTVPMGAGLSSSAALEVATLRAVRSLYNLSLDDLEIARLAQRAEAAYVGVRCGIMDQIASSLGELGSALFLDTRDLHYERVPLPAEYQVAVVDSGVPRRLAEGGYNTRRSECEQAAKLLGIDALRELNEAPLDRTAGLPHLLSRRVRHVVSENQRVLEGVRALREGDVVHFGALMNRSHLSLRNDFEVSAPELDRLVQLALENGAVGARLTGAGFGGAIVALVPKANYRAFRAGVLAGYPAARFF